jgi:hypothetical protein
MRRERIFLSTDATSFGSPNMRLSSSSNPAKLWKSPEAVPSSANTNGSNHACATEERYEPAKITLEDSSAKRLGLARKFILHWARKGLRSALSSPENLSGGRTSGPFALGGGHESVVPFLGETVTASVRRMRRSMRRSDGGWELPRWVRVELGEGGGSVPSSSEARVVFLVRGGTIVLGFP